MFGDKETASECERLLCRVKSHCRGTKKKRKEIRERKRKERQREETNVFFILHCRPVDILGTKQKEDSYAVCIYFESYLNESTAYNTAVKIKLLIVLGPESLDSGSISLTYRVSDE